MFRKNITGTRIFIFFLVLLSIIGIAIFQDYGVHYDEELQIDIAVHNYRYINQGDPALLTFQDRYYGPFFEIPLLVFFGRLQAPWMLYGRHLSVFFSYLCGLACFYFLSRKLLKNNYWALLTSVLLATHPRIFADSFYNSKDIPFLSFFVLGITSLVYLLTMKDSKELLRPKVSAIILHSLITAAVAAIRLPGLILLGISVILLAVRITVRPGNREREAGLVIVYILLSMGFLFAFSPIFWHDPLGELANAIAQTSRYTLWKDNILFLGQSFPANNAVWNYLPVWIGISTPYLALFAFVPGIFWMINAVIQDFVRVIRQKPDSWHSILTGEKLGWLAVAAWFFGPVLGAMALHTVLYDGWRQMYFIFPAMVLIGVYGVMKTYDWAVMRVQSKQVTRVIFGVILAIGILEPVVFIFQHHPFEYVYFNSLAGDSNSMRSRFDLDYWGLSYKQAVDYILANDPRDYMEVSAVGPAALYVEYVLPPDQGSRIRFSGIERADYFMTNYRWHPEDFPYPKYYSIKVDGMEIMTVYCLKGSCGN